MQNPRGQRSILVQKKTAVVPIMDAGLLVKSEEWRVKSEEWRVKSEK
jgi:hypothetical protein